jgi:hypothetical protein
MPRPRRAAPGIIPSAQPDQTQSSVNRYDAIRGFTDGPCRDLGTEDHVAQCMPDVSPTRWHLAHTSWFFQAFILKPRLRGYRELNPTYTFLFESYNVSVGERHCRVQRGYISRPAVADVSAYRRHVDVQMRDLLSGADEALLVVLDPLVETGLNPDQQHRELLLPAEWEVAASTLAHGAGGEAASRGGDRNGAEADPVEAERFYPTPARGAGGLQKMFGDVWEWTRGQYLAYPGCHPPAGALGEHNGKFVCNQFVLRGGSCATPRTYIRASCRNFFPPDACWQFTGLCLASDT